MKKPLILLTLLTLSLIYFGCRKDEDPVPVVDTTPPTAVEEIKNELVLNKDKTVIDTLKLSWEPSVDAGGMVKYKVDLLMYDDDGIAKKIRSSESDKPSLNLLTLNASKDYKVNISGVDAAGNVSSTVIQDLNSRRNGLTPKVNDSKLTISWPKQSADSDDKIEHEVNLFTYDNDIEKLTQIINDTPSTNEFSYLEYSKLKNFIIKVIVKNLTANSIETKELHLVSEKTTAPVSDFKFEKVLDPDNIKIINQLHLNWKHETHELATSTTYSIDLYILESDGSYKKIRSVSTDTTTYTFETLSNTKSYKASVSAADNHEAISYIPAQEKSIEIIGIDFTVTNPITNLDYSKELKEDDINGIKALNLTWNHTAQSDKAVMEFTLDLFEYDASGTPQLLKTIKTSDKFYSFSDLSNEKDYRLSIIASNISKEEVYTPSSAVVIKITANNSSAITSSVNNIQYEKTLDPNNRNIISKLDIKWEPGENTDVEYIVNLHMYTDSGVTQVRTTTTDSNATAFNTLSNTKNYKIEIITKDKKGNTSLSTVKEVKDNDSSIIYSIDGNQLTVVWETSINKTDQIDYDVNLYEISLIDGTTLTLSDSKNTKEDNQIFSSYDPKKQYLVEVITNNKTKETSEARQTNVSVRILPSVSNISVSRDVNEENPEKLNKIDISYDFDKKIVLAENEYFTYRIILQYYDKNNTLKHAKDKYTKEKQAYFDLKDVGNSGIFNNLLSYRVQVYTTIYSQCSYPYESNCITRKDVSTVKKSESNVIPQVNNINFTREINQNDTKVLDNLNITWDHDLGMVQTNNIKYTIDLYEYLDNNELKKVKTGTVDNKLNYSFKNIDNLKKYQVKISASSLDTSIELFDSSVATKEIPKYYENSKPSIVSGFSHSYYLSGINANWNPSTDNSTGIKYKVTLAYRDFYGNFIGLKTEITDQTKISFNDLIVENRTYRIDIIAIDIFGNESSKYNSSLLVIPRPTFSTTITQTNDDTSINFSWEKGNLFDGFKEFEVKLYKRKITSFSTVIEKIQNTTSGNISFSNLSQGTYYIVLTAIDLEGNKSDSITSEKTTLLPNGVYNGNIEINSQELINAFKNHNIHTINGSIIVTNPRQEYVSGRDWGYFQTVDQITDISPLFDGIQTITGDLNLRGEYHIENPHTASDDNPGVHLYTLDQIKYLSEVKGNVILDGFNELHLASLTSITGSLKVIFELASWHENQSQDNQINITGMRGLNHLGVNLSIKFEYNYGERYYLDMLDQLESITGDFSILGTEAHSYQFNSLKTIKGDLKLNTYRETPSSATSSFISRLDIQGATTYR